MPSACISRARRHMYEHNNLNLRQFNIKIWEFNYGKMGLYTYDLSPIYLLITYRLSILFMLSPILEILAASWVVLFVNNTIHLNTISL